MFEIDSKILFYLRNFTEEYSANLIQGFAYFPGDQIMQKLWKVLP